MCKTNLSELAANAFQQKQRYDQIKREYDHAREALACEMRNLGQHNYKTDLFEVTYYLQTQYSDVVKREDVEDALSRLIDDRNLARDISYEIFVSRTKRAHVTIREK